MSNLQIKKNNYQLSLKMYKNQYNNLKFNYISKKNNNYNSFNKIQQNNFKCKIKFIK